MELHTAYQLPWKLIFIFAAILIVARRLYWEITVGANRRRMIRENGCRPPRKYKHKGVLGHLIGLDFIRENMKNAKEGQFHEKARVRNFNESNTMQVRMLQRKIIVTTEPENVKTILSTKFNDFELDPMRMRFMTPTLGDGIFTTNGVQWERSRALIRPNFTRAQIADLQLFERHIQKLLTQIPSDGRAVDIQELFFKLSIDSATEFLFGRSTNSLDIYNDNKQSQLFTRAFTDETEAMSRDFRTGGMNRWFSEDNKKRREDIVAIHGFADSIIKEALETDIEKAGPFNSGKAQYTFLHELMKLTRDHYTIRSQLLNVLLAGRDTTASLLAHTFFVLARRPDVWEKLQSEVSTLQGQIPDYETLKSLRYVKYVLNESLRFYPVVPANARTAVRDTVIPLGGGPDGKSPCFVPKGTAVSYSVWSMHRRKDYYGEDALEYKPERWISLRPGWEYLPFNGGPRICIGQNYALTEAAYTLVRIVQHFKYIEPAESRPWTEFLTLTMAVGGGVKISLRN